MRDGGVHERMGTDEVEDGVGEGLGVVDALAWSGLRDLVGENGKPGAAARCLLLELTAERFLDCVEGEGADCRARQTVGRGGEGAVEVRIVARYLSRNKDDVSGCLKKIQTKYKKFFRFWFGHAFLTRVGDSDVFWVAEQESDG